MNAYIRAIDCSLPERVLDNAELEGIFPEWPAEKVLAKTGIARRHVAAENETASDLAVAAAERLLHRSGFARNAIDYVLFCTQTPDYVLPTTACLIQDRLGLPTHTGALDINQGCSGYVYALGVAKGLVQTGQARNVLLLTADTYTKLLNPRDRAVRTLFGDAGTATLISSTGESGTGDHIDAFVTGTDGKGARSLIVPRGGFRNRVLDGEQSTATPRTENDLFMDGPEVFSFALRVVPELVERVLERAVLSRDEVDLFVFHQANEFMLTHLRDRIGISATRFFINLRDYGNTVSSTIPLALIDALAQQRIKPGDRIVLVGFGVGFSWAGCAVRWYQGS